MPAAPPGRPSCAQQAHSRRCQAYARACLGLPTYVGRPVSRPLPSLSLRACPVRLFGCTPDLPGTQMHACMDGCMHTAARRPPTADPATGQPPFVKAFSETTAVTFDRVSDAALRAYIATGGRARAGRPRIAVVGCCSAAVGGRFGMNSERTPAQAEGRLPGRLVPSA